MEAPGSEGERRCPNCGALATADAEWCGQCFTPLPAAGEAGPSPDVDDAPVPDEPPAAVGGAVPRSPETAPMWPCPTCGNANPIELDACSVCGTSFATLMRSDEKPPDVDPKDALVASLMFPGRGQRKLGRPLDGFAWGVLFVIMCSLTLILAFAHGSSVLKSMFWLYLLLALTVYLGSAYEAYRMAEGANPLISTRQLLWATAAFVIVSVLALALSVVTVAKR